MELKKFRKKLNLTQTEIADKIKIGRQAYAYYEHGDREPSFETLIKLADFFEVSIDELLGRVPEQQIFDDARVPKTEVQEIFDSLNPVQQELSLAYMKGLVEYNRKEELKKNQQTQNKRLA